MAGLIDVRSWGPELRSETRPDGTILVWRADPLGPYPRSMNERLAHWAAAAPDRPWIAQRDGPGGWRRVTYAEGLDRVRRIGQALLDRGLGPDRPLVILSGNDIEHALMALGAQHVGVPSAAISTAYSLVSTDHGRLRDIARQLEPGLVFAADGLAYRAAIEAAFPGLPVVTAASFAGIAATEPTAAVDRAEAAVGPDTVAKYLFTSGTTGSPKAVIQTQRMLCSNQEMVADCYAFVRDEPPVLVDWAPWSHTASGNKVFHLALYNGGTYHIDEGKPSPQAMAGTIRNLREVSPSWYFNVPAGYEMLVEAMERDDALRESFFRRLRLMMYAGAGMGRHIWDRLNALSERTLGARVPLGTGLGSTETGPFAMHSDRDAATPGNVGIPAQGVTLKLVPSGDRLEARFRGPNITPGYHREPELTARAFDEEGFYRIGDALRFAVPGEPARGFLFDGRIAENFKLATGTWVGVGALRARLVDAFGGLVRDAVVAGEDRAELGALLLPFLPALRALPGVGADPDDRSLLAHPAVQARVRELLCRHAAAATGSATRVARVMLLAEPPSLDRGELTDKGSLNQRALLSHRADLVAALYDDADPRVIRAEPAQAPA